MHTVNTIFNCNEGPCSLKQCLVMREFGARRELQSEPGSVGIQGAGTRERLFGGKRIPFCNVSFPSDCKKN